MSQTKNLGTIQALYAGPSPPDNTELLWFDTTFTQRRHFAFNFISGAWEPLSGRFSAQVGGNGGKTYAIKHGLRTRDVVVEVYRADNYAEVPRTAYTTERTDADTVTLHFEDAVSPDVTYRVMVIC